MNLPPVHRESTLFHRNPTLPVASSPTLSTSLSTFLTATSTLVLFPLRGAVGKFLVVLLDPVRKVSIDELAGRLLNTEGAV
jgi:hypothetical protein